MTTQEPQTLAPSLPTLIKTTIIALAVAAVILVTFVLPAEYAIDPTGVGRRLGLTDIASPPVVAIDLPKSEGAPLAPVQTGAIGEYPAEYKFDVYEVVLEPYEFVEYKYHLEKGASMLYSWTASAPVVHDFHGERAGGASAEGAAEESFDKQDRGQMSASFAAPFAGIHGWFWENNSAEPVTVRLTSSGFYTAAIEIRSDRSRHPRPLRALSTLSPAANAGGTGQ